MIETTKLVRVYLSAYRLTEFTQIVEVPTSFTEEDLRGLADAIYQNTDGGCFKQDPLHRERGHCTAAAAKEGSIATLRASHVCGQLRMQVIAPDAGQKPAIL